MIYYTSNNIDITVRNNGDVSIITISELLSKLTEKSPKILALDTETTSLDPLTGRIIMLQFGDEEDQFIIDVRDHDITLFKDLLEDKDITFVGHNLKFDYNFLKSSGILLNNIWDTMVVDQVIHNGKYDMAYIKKFHRFSLSGVNNFYFHRPLNKRIREDFVNIGNKPFSIIHLRYGAEDVIAPLKIKVFQEELISTYKLTKRVSQENKVILCLGDIEYNGISIGIPEWKTLVNSYKPKLLQAESELDEILLNHPKGLKYKKIGKQLSLFGTEFEDKRKSIVNWSSDQQVYKILSEVFSIKPIDKYKKPSSGAEAIKFLDKEYPITNKLLQYREQSKIIDSFGESYLVKYVHKDGRIHTSLNQIVRTGRMSSSSPNLQQIKKEGGFREAFCVKPDSNKVLITADYSSQEARVMADLANDPEFIKFFKEGDGDIHSFISSKLFSVAYGHPVEVKNIKTHPNFHLRQKGKTMNFSIIYGVSAYNLSKRLKVSEKEAQSFIDAFFSAYPMVAKFFKESHEFALKKGFIRTDNITNGIRWFPDYKRYLELVDRRNLTKDEWSELGKIKGSIEREAQNAKIQGCSAAITKTALILLRNKLLEHNIKPFTNANVKVVLVVHDEIVLECDTLLADEWSKILKECMEKAASLFCKRLEIPALPNISQHWSH